MGQDCKYCGAYIAGRADKCPACGKRVSRKSAAEGSYAYQKAEEEKETKTESAAYTYKNEYEKRYGAEAEKRTEYTRAEDRPAAAKNEDDDVKQNQLISYLCYFGPLFLIPWLMRPNSEFVKFHANQGLVLLIASIVGGILAEFVPGIDDLAGWIVDLLVFVGFVRGLVNVNKGLKAELPIIGGIRILK